MMGYRVEIVNFNSSLNEIGKHGTIEDTRLGLLKTRVSSDYKKLIEKYSKKEEQHIYSLLCCPICSALPFEPVPPRADVRYAEEHRLYPCGCCGTIYGVSDYSTEHPENPDSYRTVRAVGGMDFDQMKLKERG
jgi:hypothetical protein